jgi:hypothetical protein
MSPDQQLQEAAIAMTEAAEKGRPIVPVLRARCPYVYDQLRRDARFPGLLSLWGRCVNIDENTQEVIVHPVILRALGKLAGVPVRSRVVHAGLQHTYGYLFSLIQTPFGFKRDRWTTTDLERGLGIDLSLLGERPAAGTLLANATWLLGQVAFRGQHAVLDRLAGEAAAVAPALVAYDYSALSVCRIEERATPPGTIRREVRLVTDLVTLPRAPDDDRLLVYSAQAGARAPLRLVTAFPVRPGVAEELRASAVPGGPAEVRLRYNAYVPGLQGQTLPGRRALVEAPWSGF